MANSCFKRGIAKKKAPKATDFGAGAVDDDFDIKQELLKKRGAEGTNLTNLIYTTSATIVTNRA